MNVSRCAGIFFLRKVRSILFFLFLSIIAPFSLVGQHAMPALFWESRWMVAVDAGYMRGMIKEFVYIDDYMLSRLDWDLKDLNYVGLRASHRISEKNTFSFGVWFGINSKLGVMNDYDWAEQSGSVYLKNGVWTHFSHHDNRLAHAYFADINFSRIFSETDTVSFSGLVGVKVHSIKMEAHDGYTQYPPGSSPVNIYGVGITYSVNYLTPYLGGSLRLQPAQPVAIRLTALFSHFVFARCIDDHKFRSLEFTDDIRWGRYIYLGTDVSWQFSRRFTLVLGWNLSIYPEWRSTSYLVDYGSGISGRLSSEGATSQKTMGLTASIEMVF